MNSGESMAASDVFNPRASNDHESNKLKPIVLNSIDKTIKLDYVQFKSKHLGK